MIYGGNKTVAAAGTPVPLAPQRTPACWIQIQAKSGNGSTIYVVGSGVVDSRNSSSTTDNTGGRDISPGGSIELGNSSGTNFYDLNKIYIDAATGGDGVKFLYGVR